MITIAVVNQKGGCGKTTTAVNLAAAIAERQKRALLVDLDPQAHATIGVGLDPDDLDEGIYDAFVRPDGDLSRVIAPTQMEGLSVAPGSIFLAAVDVELSRSSSRELVLSRLFADIQGDFDYCIIDCPPSFGLLTINALVASDSMIVPVLAQYYSLEGLRRVLDAVKIIHRRPDARSIKGPNILLTLVEDRTTVSRQTQAQMRQIFGSSVFKTVIHNNVRLSEAPGAGQPVLTYAPQSRGAAEYRKLAIEVTGDSTPVDVKKEVKVRRGLQKDLRVLFEAMDAIDEYQGDVDDMEECLGEGASVPEELPAEFAQMASSETDGT
jgi:chromosome partitioning protein